MEVIVQPLDYVFASDESDLAAKRNELVRDRVANPPAASNPLSIKRSMTESTSQNRLGVFFCSMNKQDY